MSDTPIRPRLDARTRNERPHVLIVTDDPGLAEFLGEGLPLGGFWTSWISSGLQALEVFRLRQFDLIAVDADMRSFDALEFLRRLRGRSDLDPNGGSRTAAPVVTFHSSRGMQQPRGDDHLGIAGQLVAPLELDDVVRTLHAVFAAWRADHPDALLADEAASRAR